MDLQGEGRRPIPDYEPMTRAVGDGAGRRAWPLWMVQLILEQLINGTAPDAIPKNIRSHAALTTLPRCYLYISLHLSTYTSPYIYTPCSPTRPAALLPLSVVSCARYFDGAPDASCPM